MNNINLTDSEIDAIRRQLKRVLESSFFRHSKRLPHLLRYVVEHTLTGEVDAIKERTLGMELFARKPDYETATDPIVRVTAGEVRKRLVQYYQEPDHANELHITLPSGSYVPTFGGPGLPPGIQALAEEDFPGAAASHAMELRQEEPFSQALPGASGARLDPSDLKENEPDTQAESAHDGIPKAQQRQHWRAIAVLGIGIGAAAVLAAAFLVLWRAPQSPIDFFWHPFLSQNQPVLISLADQSQDSIALRDPDNPSQLTSYGTPAVKNAFLTVALDNVSAAEKVIELLVSKHKQILLKGEATTDMTDLRSGPSILIGAYDNAWTLRALAPMRFRFTREPGWIPRITDTKSANRHWELTPAEGSTGAYTGYGIVARFTDSNTGMPTVIIAGLGRCGTLAAGQFVTNDNNLRELQRQARSNGNKDNIEVVLSTQVVDGQPGTPKIEAAYFW